MPTQNSTSAGSNASLPQSGEQANQEENGVQHRIVSRSEWLEVRTKLLEQEKALTRHRDLVAAERLRLPWVRVEKDYVFAGPDGKRTLSDLFDGRSQLYIKHFMMAPGAQHQCVGCSLEVDHMAGILPHLANHDVSYVVVARAPIAEIEIVRQRMGWKFVWVSSFDSEFNYDFNVSFRPEDVAAGRAQYNFRPAPDWMREIQDLSGRSVFYKNAAGEIYHTYSAYGRGGEEVLGIYGILDGMPKGRNETGPSHSLADWARPHNMYGKGGTMGMYGRFHAPNCDCAAHGPMGSPE
jgi:predicted dithiol-disulfide oxidoreductase (DUF899 family)